MIALTRIDLHHPVSPDSDATVSRDYATVNQHPAIFSQRRTMVTEKIVAALHYRGWKEVELARRSNTPISSTADYVKGKTKLPHEVAVRFAKALGVSLTWLSDNDSPSWPIPLEALELHYPPQNTPEEAKAEEEARKLKRKSTSKSTATTTESLPKRRVGAANSR